MKSSKFELISQAELEAAPKPRAKFGENGILTLDYSRWGLKQQFRLYGGRYNAKPGSFFGVAVRAENIGPGAADVHLPIIDFNVPPPAMLEDVYKAIKLTLLAYLDGRDVWVGCMGGMGRTGLFLALIAKAVGVTNPVQFVRDHYYEHAVETKNQAEYVANFDVTPLRWWLLTTVAKHKLRQLFGR